MSKLKSNRGAAKRFRAKGKGGFKAGHSHMRHILTKKTSKRKRHLGRPKQVARFGRAECAPHAPVQLRRTKWRESSEASPPGRGNARSSGKAKGYYSARRKVNRAAKQAVIKAGQYAYRDRRVRKREFRALWITRINAAARATGCRTAA